MQRIQDATRRAEREVSRRILRKRTKASKEDHWEARQQATRQRATFRENIHTERKHRRIEWETGPRLQPRWNVGSKVDQHGTLNKIMFSPIAVPKGNSKVVVPWLAEGDRVAVLAGPDKGRIGRVARVDDDGQTCTLQGLHQADIYLEPSMRQQGESRKSVPYAMPIPWSQLKLVHALRDDESGTFRDVIIDTLQVIPSRSTRNQDDSISRGRRYIPSLNLDLPWPETTATEHKTHPDDTPRLNVDISTNDNPVLAYAPMPTSVIDELRNKYSRFRTRHGPAFIAKHNARQEATERKKMLIKLVTTPSMEMYAKVKEEKEKNRQTQLSDEQLAVIGEAIVRERAEGPRIGGVDATL